MRNDYRFVSLWRVLASRGAVWEALERSLVPGPLTWWPFVSVVQAPDRPRPGAHVALDVRSVFRYRLGIDLTIVEVEAPRRLVAESTGDLVGRGSLDVTEDGPGSALTWTWEVETHRPWMRITGPLLRPVFVLAHTLVMRRGDRGFRDTVR
ncbi:MAG: SRPBCC family protein [Microbacterium sp.]